MININNIKTLYTRYEPYLSPAALAGGFVVDSLTLRRIDLWAENLVLIVYLSLVLGAILFLCAYETGRFTRKLFLRVGEYAPVFLQFVFGGLFSAFFVFYSRSASLAAGWPFLLVLLGVMVGNEFFHRRYQRFVFRLAVYFMAVFSYAVFALPLIFNRIGTGMFILSGITALGFIAGVIALSARIAPEPFKRARVRLPAAVLGIYLAFNGFYFLDLIPPIPLALKEAGVYHRITRVAGGYEAIYEPAPWYVFWRDDSRLAHWRPGENIYVFSAVFAPAELNTDIYHRWSFFDESSGEWTRRDRLGFPITGGRDGGYRGYSFKYGVQPGRWRVDVVTEDDRILGRLDFRIVETEEEPELTDKRL